jgi:N-acetylglucosamine kinase-like BadF-type ATPase
MALILGVDVGGTKTASLVVNHKGEALGYGLSGAGNYEGVGWDGFKSAVKRATGGALKQAERELIQISAAGLGIAGYDWPSLKQPHLEALREIGFTMEVEIVNDAVLGILAGAEHGWGISVVSGTGCNCRGISRDHKQEGRVVGGANVWSGEFAGGYDILSRAMRAVAFEWNRRGPKTDITDLFIKETGAKDLNDLIEGMYTRRFNVHDPTILMKVFQIAEKGDPEAKNIMLWAGNELGKMALGVITQLGLHDEPFDVVLIGSIFDGHPNITKALKTCVRAEAPNARFIRLVLPPVVGAVLLGMEQLGIDGFACKETLISTTQTLIASKN